MLARLSICRRNTSSAKTRVREVTDLIAARTWMGGTKIECHCGALILDQSDVLPQKAHLIPDQEWLALHDALDSKVIDALADRRIDRNTAYHRLRQLIVNATRLVWQCRECGRLYVDDLAHEVQCYLPADAGTVKEIGRLDMKLAGRLFRRRSDELDAT